MTVKQLIKELNKVEDKHKQVVFYNTGWMIKVPGVKEGEHTVGLNESVIQILPNIEF